MRKGLKLTSLKDISDGDQPIFKKNKTYEVIFVDNEKPKIQICLTHEGFGCREFNLEWIVKNFKL